MYIEMSIELGRKLNVLRDLKAVNANIADTVTCPSVITTNINTGADQIINSVTTFNPPIQGSHLSIALSPVNYNIVAVGDYTTDSVYIYEFDETTNSFNLTNTKTGPPGSRYGTHVAFDSTGLTLVIAAPNGPSFAGYADEQHIDVYIKNLPPANDQNRGCLYRWYLIEDTNTPLEIPLDAVFTSNSSILMVGYQSYYSNSFTVDATANIFSEFSSGISYGSVYSLSYESNATKRYTIMKRMTYQPYMTQPFTSNVNYALYDTEIHNVQAPSFCGIYDTDPDGTSPVRMQSDVLPVLDSSGTYYLTSNLTSNVVNYYHLDNLDINTIGRMESITQPILLNQYSDSTLAGFGKVINISVDGSVLLIGGTSEFKIITSSYESRINPAGGAIRKLVMDASQVYVFAACEKGVYVYTRNMNTWSQVRVISMNCLDVQIQQTLDSNHFYVLTLNSTGNVARYDGYITNDLNLNAKMILGGPHKSIFNLETTLFTETIDRTLTKKLRPGSSVSADGRTVAIVIPQEYENDDGDLFVDITLRVYDNYTLVYSDVMTLSDDGAFAFYYYRPDVCISGDGNTIFVSGNMVINPGSFPFTFSGESYIFVRNGTSFDKKTVDFAASGEAGGVYHNSSISYKGDVISFGVNMYDNGYIVPVSYMNVVSTTNGWDSIVTRGKFNGQINTSNLYNAGDMYSGYQTSMTSDGKTVVNNVLGNGANGNLEIRDWNGSSYVLRQTLSGPYSYTYFGWYVKISDNGNTIVTGSPDYKDGLFIGSFQIFKLNETTNLFEFYQEFYPEPNTPDQAFCAGLAISDNCQFVYVYQSGFKSKIVVYKWNGYKYVNTGYIEAVDEYSNMRDFSTSSDGTILAVPVYNVDPNNNNSITVSPVVYKVSLAPAKDTTVQSDLNVVGITNLDVALVQNGKADVFDVTKLTSTDVTISDDLTLGNKITQQQSVNHNELCSSRVAGSSFFNVKNVALTGVTGVKRLANVNWVLTPTSISVLNSDDTLTTVRSGLSGVGTVNLSNITSNVLVTTSTGFVEISNTSSYANVIKSISASFCPPRGVASIYGNVFVSNYRATSYSNVAKIDKGTPSTPLGVYNVGQSPSTIRVINSNLWVTSNQYNTVTVINPRTNASNVIHVGGFPDDILDAFGNIWVMNSASYNLSKVNSTTFAVIDTVPLGPIGYTLPGHLTGIAQVGNLLAVTDDSKKILFVDPYTYDIVDTITTSTTPYSVTYDDTTSKVLIATSGGTIAEYTRGALSTTGPVVQNSAESGLNILGATFLSNILALSYNVSSSSSTSRTLPDGFTVYSIEGSPASQVTVTLPSVVDGRIAVIINRTGQSVITSSPTVTTLSTRTTILIYMSGWKVIATGLSNS